MTDVIYFIKDTFPQAAASPELLLGAGVILAVSLIAYLMTRSKECLLCFFATALYTIPMIAQ